MSVKVKQRKRAARHQKATHYFQRAAQDTGFRENEFLPWLSTLRRPHLWGIKETITCQP